MPAHIAADTATTDDLSGAVRALLPALTEFQRFTGPDPAARRSQWLPRVDRPLPRAGLGRDTVLRELAEVVIGSGLRLGHPGFTGWVTTAPSDVAAAAGLAQSVAVPQKWWATPGNYLDHLAMRWLIELLGFPESFVGTFTSGGSTANLVGLGAARQRAGERRGLDPAQSGIEGLHAPRVYCSTATHHVVGRALGVLGLGRGNRCEIPLDSKGTIDLDLLQQALDRDITAGCTPIAIVGCAGDVNTGLVDPLPELVRIAQDRDIWLHVDGAYGGWGVLDERVRARYGDLSQYDSFAIDPHKWLAAPVGTGAVIVRDPEVLARAFAIESGDYDRVRVTEIGTADTASPFEEIGYGTPDWGVDFSTPARGLAVWAVLAEIGAEGVRDRIVRHDDCARRVADLARSSEDLELLSEPMLSITCFRFHPPGMDNEPELDQLNEDILTALRSRGRSITSSTRVRGRFALRPCFINPRNTLAEADELVTEVLAVGRDLSPR